EKQAYLIINFNTDALAGEIDLLNRLTNFDTYIINNQRQFLYYKSQHVKLDYIYEHPEENKIPVEKLFSPEDAFNISDAYFFKIKIPLYKAKNSKYNRFMYLAIELPAQSYSAYRKSLFRKIMSYGLPLFILALVVIYTFLFLTLLINRGSAQLRRTLKLIELSEEGVVVTDERGIIEYINPAFEKMFRCSSKDTLGVNILKFKSSYHDENFHAAMWKRLNSVGKWEGDIIDQLEDKSLLVKHLKIEKLSDPKTGRVMYFGIYNDISKLRDSRKLVERLSSLDYLTGLPNKQTLLTRISEKTGKLAATGGKFSIASVAIYNLKEINDSYGFDIGDKTILLFVERIKGKINNDDILGRISDNHFLLISDGNSLESMKHYISELFRNCISTPFSIVERDIYLSINVGISTYPDNGTEGQELIKAASLARGDKRPDDKLAVNFYSDRMSLKAKEKSNLLSLLEKAVQQEEFYLEFQPKVDSRNGRAVGSEALIRWNNEKLGKVAPAEFIPLAEENGLIGKISYWLIHRLCAQIKTWKEQGLPVKPVSFNLSVYDFDRENFPSCLFACAEKHGVDAHDLQIELTERIFAQNKDNVIKKMEQLRNKGFKILIDDFGTGYSSLEYLRDFKIDILKIDRAFIKDYPKNSDIEIIKTICELAHSLDMEIICEGVETKSQLDFLNSIGCYIIQGFYYSQPVSPEVFAKMLVEGKIARS
ncbi:MAG: EAL domain-containing protein, partial [Victivallales bacterium]|nr:EAL domain-containing protein [Victivallales bacterium]